MRVPDYLAGEGVAFETLWHPPAYTASRRARYLRVPGRRFAKAVLLVGPDGPFVAILPATHRIDLALLSSELGGPVRLAGEHEVAEQFTDCEWGVVPPFGSVYCLGTVLDASLAPDAVLVFEGNTHLMAVQLSCRDFERVERPRRMRFAHPA
jgi:Ala-tRNA(Pro) deacylase